jgi:hypothetical protein
MDGRVKPANSELQQRLVKAVFLLCQGVAARKTRACARREPGTQPGAVYEATSLCPNFPSQKHFRKLLRRGAAII